MKIIFRNTLGHGNAARKVMAKGCVNTLFMYASTVYVKGIGQFKSAVKTIRKAQRLMNILCSRAYKDISFIASTVLAGMPPLDFLIEKRSILYCVKKCIEPVPWVQLGPLEIRGKTLKGIKLMIDERISIEWQKL